MLVPTDAYALIHSSYKLETSVRIRNILVGLHCAILRQPLNFYFDADVDGYYFGSEAGSASVWASRIRILILSSTSKKIDILDFNCFVTSL